MLRLFRSHIVPIRRRLPIARMLPACRQHAAHMSFTWALLQQFWPKHEFDKLGSTLPSEVPIWAKVGPRSTTPCRYLPKFVEHWRTTDQLWPLLHCCPCLTLYAGHVCQPRATLVRLRPCWAKHRQSSGRLGANVGPRTGKDLGHSLKRAATEQPMSGARSERCFKREEDEPMHNNAHSRQAASEHKYRKLQWKQQTHEVLAPMTHAR